MDAIGLGAINLDIVVKVPRIPRLDDEVFATSFFEKPGGSAANTIVGMTRLGAKTGFIGKVGNDVVGGFLLSEFRKEGVDISQIKTIEGQTGRVFVFLSPKGIKMIVASGVANTMLGQKDVNPDYLRQARFLHITSLIGEDAFDAVVYTASLAKKLGLTVSVDPGPIFAEKGLERLSALLKNTDVFFPSRIEVKMLTGKNYRGGASELLSYVDTVVVKRGEDGCFVKSKEEDFEVPAFKIKPVGTLGAGDSFCAGFLASLIKGKDLRAAATYATAVATLTTQGVGARDALPNAAQVEKFLGERYEG
jgi:ribokinase